MLLARAKVNRDMGSGNCSPDGTTLIMGLIFFIFIGAMGGLFSRKKENREAAFFVASGIVIGGTLITWALAC